MPFRELSQEEYNALTPEQKIAYDQEVANINAQAAVEQSAADARAAVQAATSRPADVKTTSTSASSGGGASHSSTTQTGNSNTSGTSNTTQSREIDWANVGAQTAAEIAERHRRMGDVWNPETKTWESPSVLELLGIRDRVREQREEQERRNKLKQRASAFYNAGALISDIISAGVGGNVWKRDKDTTAADAAKDNERLRELQAAEDAAYAEQERKRRLEEWQAEQALREKAIERNTKLVSRNTTSQNTQHIGSSVTNGTTNNWQGAQTIETTNYSDAMKGGGLAGRSRRVGSGGSGGGSHEDTDYLPLLLMNAPHGQEYISFEISKAEKAALSQAIAASIQSASSSNQYAAALLEKYYTPAQPAKRGKPATPEKWNYDGLINDASLYQVPAVLNRYLDELTNIGITHTENGAEVPYSRTELYEMMTGDENQERVPAGVILGTSRL